MDVEWGDELTSSFPRMSHEPNKTAAVTRPPRRAKSRTRLSQSRHGATISAQPKLGLSTAERFGVAGIMWHVGKRPATLPAHQRADKPAMITNI
jgi:hypothetical protein